MENKKPQQPPPGQQQPDQGGRKNNEEVGEPIQLPDPAQQGQPDEPGMGEKREGQQKPGQQGGQQHSKR